MTDDDLCTAHVSWAGNHEANYAYAVGILTIMLLN